MGTIETSYATITYNDDEQTQRKVFERIIKYFKEHESFCGESIQQNDDPIIDAPNVMSEIADDILKFTSTYKE